MPEALATPPAPAAPKAPSTPAPSSFPAPGPARAGFYAAIEKKAQGATPTPAKPPEAPKPPTPKPAPKEVAKTEAAETPEVETDEFSDATSTPTEPKPAEEPKATETTAPPKDAPKGKAGKEPGPWALKKMAEDRALTAERELEQYRKAAPNAERLKEQQEKFQTIQKRNEELESEIRFVSYTKSKDFIKDYQKPLDEAWQTTMNDLAEIPVTDANGTRALTVDDIAQLVYMPLARAKEEAVAKFGSFADDVMAARKEIRRLGDQREKAIEKAKVEATEREKQLTEQWQNHRATLKTEISTAWQEENDALKKHPKFGSYFSPTEGDSEEKATLEKGESLWKEAYAMNAADPKLTSEQRRSAIKKQAAQSQRSIAFGLMAKRLFKASARVKELEAKVAELEGGEPTVDGRNGGPAVAPAANAEDSLNAAIEKRAKLS